MFCACQVKALVAMNYVVCHQVLSNSPRAPANRVRVYMPCVHVKESDGLASLGDFADSIGLAQELMVCLGSIATLQQPQCTLGRD